MVLRSNRDFFEMPKFIPSQYPDADGFACVEIKYPDDPAYLKMLQGLVAVGTYYWNYEGTTDDRKIPANLWLAAYVATDWENCVNCQEIIDCIENDPDVQAALAAWFSNAVDNDLVVQAALQRAFDASTSGSAIPEGYANQNQYGAALGCDMDDGWGHIRDGLIPRSFQRVTDVLELIEFHTDNQEMLAEFLNAIPVIGALFDVVPVTDWVLFFDNVRAWMKEAFEAGDTTELRDEIACDLFCIWQVDCSLSVDQIRRYYWGKTEATVPSWEGAFQSMTSLAAALATGSLVEFGNAVVYALVGSQYGFLTFINDWFGIHINATSSDLALGDPSDDWETLCLECPPDVITYYLEPVDEYLTLETAGTILPSNYVEITSPNRVTLTITSPRTMTNILIQIASFEAVTYDAIINGETYSIPEVYPGFGVGHDINVDVSETSAVVVIQCSHTFLMHHITVTFI